MRSCMGTVESEMAKRSRMKSKPGVLIVHFLVPLRDREGRPYPRSVHQDLRRDLEDRFSGWSSLGDAPMPGAWRNPRSGEVEYDDSWRYEVGIAADRLGEFDNYLAVLSCRLGQEAILRVFYRVGEGKAIKAREGSEQE